MPVYTSQAQLDQSLRLLFHRILEQGPGATRSLSAARLVLSFQINSPTAQVSVDGRANPVRIHFGPVAGLRPDLEVRLTADALHEILLGELRLRNALGSGVLKVKGPLWKTFALEEILHQGQALYPQVARELGLGSFGP